MKTASVILLWIVTFICGMYFQNALDHDQRISTVPNPFYQSQAEVEHNADLAEWQK